jgi:hypothetical protein
MEENIRAENESKMYLDTDGIRQISATRKWALFMACLFVFWLLANIFNIVQGLIKSLSNVKMKFNLSNLITTLVFCSIYSIIAFYLSRYSILAKKAINRNDPQSLFRAIKNLKNYFAFLSIFLGIFLVFYLIYFIGNLIKPNFLETLRNIK